MKNVFTNNMTAHVWAQQEQFSGRSTNGNLYFEGPTLFSYGDHFAVGYVLPDGRCLLNTAKYSATTTAHQWRARGACRHRECLDVPNLTALLPYLPSSRRRANRTGVRHHVSANIGDYDEDSARAILDLAGLPRSLAAIRKEAARRAARRARIAARRKNADTDRAVRYLAAESDTDFALRIADAQSHSLKKWSRDLYRMRRRAVTHHSARTADLILARLNWVRAELRGRSLHLGRSRAHRTLAGAISAVRFLSTETGSPRDYLAAKIQHRLTVIAETTACVPPSIRERARAQIRENMPLVGAYRARLESEAISRARESIALWRAGENPAGIPTRPTLLRIRGDLIETSMGAAFPSDHGARAWPVIRKCRERGSAWEPNGAVIRLGHFNIDRIEADGTVVAGCHTIAFGEIERTAADLGLIEADTSADSHGFQNA